MQILSEKVDQYLLDVAWSLWTELGVAGVKKRHQNTLISLEELILLTAVLGDKDPRLRDEALDWCVRFHHFVSISRLQAIIKSLGASIHRPFSLFSVTLNAVSSSKWPVLMEIDPLKYKPSGKSQPPRCELPSLFSLRLRALFGVGARADLMTFFLLQKKEEFTAADTADIGYSKRSLSDLLEDFICSGLFEAYTKQNKRYYRIINRNQMLKILGKLPKVIPKWKLFLEVLLPLSACIQQVENKSKATKFVEMRNVLKGMEDSFRRMNISLPPMHQDPDVFWNSFTDWIFQVFLKE